MQNLPACLHRTAMTNNTINTINLTAIPETLMRPYFRAKDQNRPHLMEQAFAPQTRLEMTVKTSAISFPAITEGVGPIPKNCGHARKSVSLASRP